MTSGEVLNSEVVFVAPRPSLAQPTARLALRARVRGCTACSLHTAGPVPPPATPARLAVLERTGDPSLTVGRWLRAAVPERTTVLHLGTVLCPVQGPGGRRAEATGAQMAQCREHVVDALSVAGVRRCLLVGQEAVDTWLNPAWDSLPVERVAGVVASWPEARCWVMAVPAPGKGVNGGKVLSAIRRFVDQPDADMMDLLEPTCVRCEGWVSEMTKDGLMWCEGCWEG